MAPFLGGRLDIRQNAYGSGQQGTPLHSAIIAKSSTPRRIAVRPLKVMARRRFFVDEVRRGEAELDGEEAEHLTRVLRAENGQRYKICDGARLFVGEIVEARKRSVRFRILEELPVAAPALGITLL